MKLTATQESARNLSAHIAIKAAAGTGKTTMLINRLLEIAKHTDLTHCVAITYTKKAAQEMHHRLHQHHPNAMPFIGTIHAFCHRILSQCPFEADVAPGFTILDTTKAKHLVQLAITTTLAHAKNDASDDFIALLNAHSLTQLITILTQASRHLDTLNTIPTDPHTAKFHHLLIQTAHHYSQLKLAQNSLDYDDLIIKTNRLYATHPGIVTRLTSHIHYILFDEFQDTNDAQWALISGLFPQGLQATPNLFIVGDTKQSIYGFRGANPEVFHKVQAQFETTDAANVLIADDNFRCNTPVVNWTNHIFSQLFDTYTPMIGHRNDTGSVSFYSAHDPIPDQTKLTYIANWVAHHHSVHNIPFNQIAILARTKKQFAKIAATLHAHHIPTTISDGQGFFQTQEVIDCINLLHAIQSPTNPTVRQAIANSPFHSVELDTVSHQKDHLTPTQLLTQILTDSGAMTYWTSQPNGTQHQANIFKLIDWIEHHLTQDPTQSIADIVQLLQTAILTQKNEPEAPIDNAVSNSVQIMSIHAAKGLEFEAVLLTDCDTRYNFGLMSPLKIHHNQMDLKPSVATEPSDTHHALIDTIKAATIAEENRVFYVACTRAKQYLHIVTTLPKTTPKSIRSLADTLSQHLMLTEKNTIAFRHDPTITYPNTPKLTPTPIAQQIAQPSTPTPESTPLPPITPPITLSITTLLQALTCPKRYTLASLSRWIDETNRLENDHQELSAAFGTITHLLFNLAIDYPDQRPEHLFELGLQTQTHHHDLAIAQRDSLVSQLRQFMTSQCFKQIQAADQVICEHPFTLTGPHITISGRYDVLIYQHNHWHIIDFKTDQHHQTPDKHTAQLTWYATALAQRTKQDRVDASVYYTKTGSQHTTTINQTDINTCHTLLADLHTTLTTPLDTPPPKTTCESCPIYTHNPACPST